MKWAIFRGRRLRTQVTLIVLGGTLISLLPVLAFGIRLYIRQLETALEQRAQAMTELVATNIRATVDAEDAASVQKMLARCWPSVTCGRRSRNHL